MRTYRLLFLYKLFTKRIKSSNHVCRTLYYVWSIFQVYEESIEYVMGIVAPITDWVDMELLSPAEYYVDCYLPELDLDQKTSKCFWTYLNFEVEGKAHN